MTLEPGRDNHRVGRRQVLQARRQIERLADDHLVFGITLEQQIAGHYHTGGDPDSHRQGHPLEL